MAQALFRHVPIRRPDAATIRRRIADAASAISARPAARYLALIGPVEPALVVADAGEASWRLASYHGSYEDNHVIECAVTAVQRTTPLMQV